MAESLLDRVGPAVEGLTPGYFALVMASGILSIGMKLEGFHQLSTLLLGVTAAAWLVLGVRLGTAGAPELPAFGACAQNSPS